ncbi:MAG: GNAT family N-acetyltransferase [Planctomycetota bacterium]|nr:GNAT family N-acetyltransferase [Planctomycetota bacterium]MDW8372542.1 GNAT family N-acetyltransferase [Planctomycetota bacterium]
MADYALVDLDQRPDLAPRVLSMFAAAGPGPGHVVCGIPPRMGLEPGAGDLAATLGVLIALSGRRIAGVLAVCPYSAEQVTLWGPLIPDPREQPRVLPLLVQEVRQALREGNYASMRAPVDQRNRTLRAWLLAAGFQPWKDFHCYEHELVGHRHADLGPVQVAARDDFEAVARVLQACFPDSDHCRVSLVQRENEGYRHYLLRDGGQVVGAAAVQAGGRRSWLKLIGIDPAARGRHLSRALLAGILAAEAKLNHQRIGLEVFADNRPAIALYERAGFLRAWTASLLVAPA